MTGQLDRLDQLLDQLDQVISLMGQVATEHPDLPAALVTIRRMRAEFRAHAGALLTLRSRCQAQGLGAVADEITRLVDSLPAEVRP